MFSESQLLPISALQHLAFCRRQCALIHIEGLWAENRLTVEGRQLHEKAHGGAGESRAGVRIARGLPLRSLRLGLVGVADVVEFRQADQAGDTDGSGANPERSPPATLPFPVEYKRGKPKRDNCDRIQLCAQALCIEEMLDTRVPCGALFYGRTRRRLDVIFDDDLRQLTETTAAQLHELIAGGRTPPARVQPKCRRCSMRDLCMPGAGTKRSASRYLRRMVREINSASTSTADPSTAGNRQDGPPAQEESQQ